MGKRSSFARRERDYYPTPPEAVAPLLRRLDREVRFCEPCAGDGALVRELERAGHVCTSAFDIDAAFGRKTKDASTAVYDARADSDYFITNPPWSRDLLHPIITNLSSQLPAWQAAQTRFIGRKTNAA